MSTELTTTADSSAIIGYGSVEGFALSQRVAQVFASSEMVPKAYQNNLPNCIIAVNMAIRMDADPLMVMQNLYIVHGSPSWSSKFLIACFNQTGRFSSLRYKEVGEQDKDTWGIYSYAVEKSTGETINGPTVTIKMAKAEGWYQKNGSKWQTMPELMLRYRAATFFVRTYAPEIGMGLQTHEEIVDTLDMQRDERGAYVMAEPAPEISPEDALTEELSKKRNGRVIEANAAPASHQPPAQPLPEKDAQKRSPAETVQAMLDAAETVEAVTAASSQATKFYNEGGQITMEELTGFKKQIAAKLKQFA